MKKTEFANQPTEGLQKDPVTGHYRVESGYGYQANRYKIHETWLDEDDNVWIDGEAVRREDARSNDERS